LQILARTYATNYYRGDQASATAKALAVDFEAVRAHAAAPLIEAFNQKFPDRPTSLGEVDAPETDDDDEADREVDPAEDEAGEGIEA
jgi:hypothetical protein